MKKKLNSFWFQLLTISCFSLLYIIVNCMSLGFGPLLRTNKHFKDITFLILGS